MSLEEKALQLTQFPSYELDDNQEKIVTGFSRLGSVERESLWHIGTILNAPNAEAVQFRHLAYRGLCGACRN